MEDLSNFLKESLKISKAGEEVTSDPCLVGSPTKHGPTKLNLSSEHTFSEEIESSLQMLNDMNCIMLTGGELESCKITYGRFHASQAYKLTDSSLCQWFYEFPAKSDFAMTVALKVLREYTNNFFHLRIDQYNSVVMDPFLDALKDKMLSTISAYLESVTECQSLFSRSLSVNSVKLWLPPDSNLCILSELQWDINKKLSVKYDLRHVARDPRTVFDVPAGHTARKCMKHVLMFFLDLECTNSKDCPVSDIPSILDSYLNFIRTSDSSICLSYSYITLTLNVRDAVTHIEMPEIMDEITTIALQFPNRITTVLNLFCDNLEYENTVELRKNLTLFYRPPYPQYPFEYASMFREN